MIRWHKFKRGNRGFSLTEVAAAMFALSLGVPAISMMYSASLALDSDSTKETQAYFLANALMNEISHRRFEESTTQRGNQAETGEVSGWSRIGFDDIDDYQQFQTWGLVKPPRDEAGVAIPGVSEFSQSVSVINVPAPPTTAAARTLSTSTAGTTSYKVVTVKVFWNGTKRFVTVNKMFAMP